MAAKHGKYFTINPTVNSGLLIEVQDAEDKPGVKVITGEALPESQNASQIWYYDRLTLTIRSDLNGFCLDLKDDELVVNPFQKGKESQRWNIHQAEGTISQAGSPQNVLSVFEDNENPGASIYSQENEEKEGQKFVLSYRPVRYFYIRQQEKPSLVMDVAKANIKPGASIVVFRDKGKMDDNQLWYEDESGVIRSKLNGFAMEGSGSSVILLPYDENNPMMQWVITGNTISNRSDSNQVLANVGGGGFLRGPPSVAATEFTGDDDAQHWSCEYIPDQSQSLNHSGNGKHFFIRNRWSGLVLQVRDGIPDPATEVVTAYRVPNASMADHQLFYEDEQTGTIRTALNGYCIDIVDDVLVVNPYDPYSKQQQWRKFGRKIQNRSKLNEVLQVAEASMDAGANVIPGEYRGEDEQLWDVTYIQAKTFYITSLLNGKVLDVRKDQAVSGAKVIMWDKKGGYSANQIWYEDERGIIRTKLNGFVLDTTKGRAVLNPYDPTNDHQQWTVVGDRVQNRADSKMVMEIEKSSTKNDANVGESKFHGGDNQRWKFEYV